MENDLTLEKCVQNSIWNMFVYMTIVETIFVLSDPHLRKWK